MNTIILSVIRAKENVKGFSLKDFLARYKFSIILFIYLLVIAYNQVGRIYGKNVFSIICIILVINALSKIRYTQVLSALLIFFISFDAYFAFVYGQMLSATIGASIIETNVKEAKGMLFEALLPALAILITTSFLYIKLLIELRKSSIPKWFSLSFVSAVLLVAMPIFILVQQKKDKAHSKFAHSGGVVSYINSYASNTLVFGNISTFMLYKAEMDRMQEYGHHKRVLAEGIKRSENSSVVPEKLFIIIGESSSRNNYSLYGYSRSTTPFLDSLRLAGATNFFHYAGISAASITRDAVPMALSFATPTDQQYFYNQMNAIDLAKKCGIRNLLDISSRASPSRSKWCWLFILNG